MNSIILLFLYIINKSNAYNYGYGGLIESGKCYNEIEYGSTSIMIECRPQNIIKVMVWLDMNCEADDAIIETYDIDQLSREIKADIDCVEIKQHRDWWEIFLILVIVLLFIALIGLIFDFVFHVFHVNICTIENNYEAEHEIQMGNYSELQQELLPKDTTVNVSCV